MLYNSFNLTSVICLHTKFVLFDPYMGLDQELATPIKVNVGVMAMKGYSTSHKSPHHHMVYFHYQDIRWGVLPFCWHAVDWPNISMVLSILV